MNRPPQPAGMPPYLHYSRYSSLKQKISWLLVCVCALLIFMASSTPGHDISSGSGILGFFASLVGSAAEHIFGHPVDVSPIGHFIEYFALGGLLANALHYHVPLRSAVVLAILLATVYGLTDEIHQLFVPDRMFDLVDLLVDCIGAACASALYAFFENRWIRKQLTSFSRN